MEESKEPKCEIQVSHEQEDLPRNISGDVSLLSSISKTPTIPDEYSELQSISKPAVKYTKHYDEKAKSTDNAKNAKSPIKSGVFNEDKKNAKNGDIGMRRSSNSKSNVGSNNTVSSSDTGGERSNLSPSTPDFIEDAEELMEDFVDVAVDAGHMIRKEVIEGIEKFVTPEDFSSDYSWVDGLFGVISIVTFSADFISDVFLSSTMEDDPKAKYWATATLLLAVIPLIIQNLFSIYWYWFDERQRKVTGQHVHRRRSGPAKWALIVFFHLILMAPVLRQIDVIYYGVRSKKKKNDVKSGQSRVTNSEEIEFDTPREKGETTLLNVKLPEPSSHDKQARFRERWLHSEIDSAGLDFIGTVTQDVPQLVLQLYVITQTLPFLSPDSKINQTLLAQLASISLSLFTTAWTVTGFVRAVRLPESGLRSLSPLEIVLLTLSHFCAIAPQVGCFALFASNQLTAFLIVLVGHWLLAAMLTFFQLLWLPVTAVRKAMFAHDKQTGVCPRLDDLAFSSALGVALLVTFVDVDGAAPHLQAAYFGIARFIEELIFVTIWYLATSRTSWWHWFPFLLISVFFLLCILFSVLFYVFMKRGAKSQWNSFRSLPQTPS